MSARPYDGRHRGGKHATPKHAGAKRRRVMAGLALPTAAAAALTFTATGAAFAGKTRAAGSGDSGPKASSVATMGSASAALKAVEDKALAKARADSVVARAAERKNLAAWALTAKRAAEAHAWQLPITNPVRTSPFGYRWGRLHAGEDFAVSEGTNLASMSTGTVVFAGPESGYGILVKIRYWDGTISYYGHMSHLSVTAGESV